MSKDVLEKKVSGNICIESSVIQVNVWNRLFTTTYLQYFSLSYGRSRKIALSYRVQ